MPSKAAVLDLPPFPDVERVVADAFADVATSAAAEVVTVLPADLQSALPIIRVRRLGGGDDRWTDRPRVDVEVYGPSREVAKPLALSLQARLLSFPIATGHGVIDRVSTEVGPQEIPYTDQDIRLFPATYRLSLRRF
jgi:hypothetical protein